MSQSAHVADAPPARRWSLFLSLRTWLASRSPRRVWFEVRLQRIQALSRGCSMSRSDLRWGGGVLSQPTHVTQTLLWPETSSLPRGPPHRMAHSLEACFPPQQGLQETEERVGTDLEVLLKSDVLGVSEGPGS